MASPIPAGSAVPPMGALQAPTSWRTVDFISDLHLQASEPATFDTWKRYLASTPADAVFMLGDLFELWAGDDMADSPGFEADCVAVMAAASRRCELFFLHGNRDFLVGERSMHHGGATLLADPVVLAFAGERWLLSHGDALCLEDTQYQKFRTQVRDPGWQQQFLTLPLATRLQVARGVRNQSDGRRRATEADANYADVDPPAARAWLQAAQAKTLIHGHTHRPACHALGDGLRRIVLSDWDLAAIPPRAEVLRLDAHGLQRLALT